jgi:hypothetical protein
MTTAAEWLMQAANVPPPATAEEVAAAILAAAQATPIHADVKRINNVSVKGSGKEGDTWGPA